MTTNGSSLAAPQVSAAAALLQAINPRLTAAGVKRILTESASSRVERNGVEKNVPTNMGAGILRLDEAVLQLINEMREASNQEKFDRDILLATRRVILTAKLIGTGPGQGQREWLITAVVAEGRNGNTALQIRTLGNNMIFGNTTQNVSVPGSVTWTVITSDDKSKVFVYRLDNGGCAFLELSLLDLDGLWSGNWMMTASDILKDDFRVDEFPDDFLEVIPGGKEACENMGTDIIKDAFMQLQNKEVPATLILRSGETEGAYMGRLTIHIEEVFPDNERADPMYFEGLYQNGVLRFVTRIEDPEQKNPTMNMYFEGSLVNDKKLEGTFRVPAGDFNLMSGSWEVTKIGD